MEADIEKLLYDYDTAAEILSLSRAALRDLVYKGRGPRVTRIGRRTFFARKDLEYFVEAHRDNGLIKPVSTERAKKLRRGRPTITEQMMRTSTIVSQSH